MFIHYLKTLFIKKAQISYYFDINNKFDCYENDKT